MKLVIDIPDDEYEFIKVIRPPIIVGRGYATLQYNVINAIKNGIPYEDRPKGKWVTKPHVHGVTYCSECDFELKIDDTNFCPNCGADMRGEENEKI